MLSIYLDKLAHVQVVYLDKLAHIQVVINCQYSVAQMCTHKDTLAHYLGAPFIDDVMRHNMLRYKFKKQGLKFQTLNISKIRTET